MIPKKFAMLFVCAILFVDASFAQEKKDGLPITVKIATSVNLPNGAVTLAGTSNSLTAGAGQVFIEIKTPDAKVEKLTAITNKTTGAYTIQYTPKLAGKYAVTAFPSDRKQSAVAEFTVSPAIAINEEFTKFDAAKSKSLAALESSVNTTLAGMADAADAAKAKQEIEKVKKKIKEFDEDWGKMKEALKEMQDLAKKAPEINDLAAADLAQMGSTLEESSDVIRQVEKDLGASKGIPEDPCNNLYKVSEACAAFSTGMNLASGGIIAIGKSIFIDKVWPKIEEKYAPKVFNANDNFIFKQAGKTGLTATDGMSALKTKSFTAGMGGDLMQFISDEMFKKYCTEYKGPVTGTYGVEFKSDGKTWLKYTLTYEGKISVYCRKDKINGMSPKMKGYLEGNVTHMDFTDDVWAIEDKNLWDEIKYQRIPAPVIPFSTSDADPGFGAAARAAGPGSFYFPLEAQLVQGKIVIKLLPAVSDFTSNFTNATVMVVRAKKEPHNVDGAVFQYPIQKAWFILTRSMRIADASPTITLDMKTQNGVTEIQKDFSRTETPGADTRVDFALKLKMSNQ